MSLELQKEIFQEALEFFSQGEIYEEKEIITPGCFSSSVETEIKRKYITSVELENILKNYSIDEINEDVEKLIEKGFIRGNRIGLTTGNTFYEITECLCDLDEFLEDL